MLFRRHCRSIPRALGESVRSMAVVFLVLLLACDLGRELDVARIAGNSRPFDELQGVRLGMTAEALRALRPTVQPSGYAGYSDELQAGVVSFAFPGASEHGAPPPGAKLQLVSAYQRVSTDSVAVRLWAGAIRDASRSLGPPTRCTLSNGSLVRTREARWVSDTSVFSLAQHSPPQFRTARGDSARAASVIAEVRRPSRWVDRIDAAMSIELLRRSPKRAPVPMACP